MDQFTSWDRREEKLWQILSEENPHDRLYVYWLQNGKRILPSIHKFYLPFEDLYEFLRDEYGCQSYELMIRRGKKMILTHTIHIDVPLSHFPRKDIRAEIEKLRREERRDIHEIVE